MTPHQTPPSDKLLPCPFCGSSDVLRIQKTNHVENGCAQCGSVANEVFWNRRSNPPSVPTDEMVEAFLDAFHETWRVQKPDWIEMKKGKTRKALTATLAAMPGGVDESNTDPDSPTGYVKGSEFPRLTPSAIGAEGWRSCLEQARDRMQQVEDFKAGKASCLPACEAAIAHADMLLTTPPTAQEGK